jgi:hypothetical protein
MFQASSNFPWRLVLLALLLLAPLGAIGAPKAPTPKAAKKPPPVRGASAPHARPVNLKPAPAPDAAPAVATPGGGGAPPPSRGPSRIDFDDRLIQGQTNRSGAVYLYDRKELKVRSMIKTPDNFRDQIVGAVYDTP